LKDKKQTGQQQKQAIHSISLYYELKSKILERMGYLKINLKKNQQKKGFRITNHAHRTWLVINCVYDEWLAIKPMPLY
jgi:hypothetical protein